MYKYASTYFSSSDSGACERPSRPTAASSIVERASIIEQTCSLSASLASQLIISSVLFRKCGFICDCSAFILASCNACCSRYMRSNWFLSSDDMELKWLYSCRNS